MVVSQLPTRQPNERRKKGEKMRNKNSSCINFLKKNAEFADIANLALFQGNPVIKAEHLFELDTSELIHITKTNSTSKPVPIQRYRDVLKSSFFHVTSLCNLSGVHLFQKTPAVKFD